MCISSRFSNQGKHIGVEFIRFAPDSETAALVGDDGRVRIFDAVHLLNFKVIVRHYAKHRHAIMDQDARALCLLT